MIIRLKEEQVVSIKEVFTQLKYKWFDGNKPYNVNIFGVRNANERIPLKFDDMFYCVYRNTNLEWECIMLQCTTDPSTYYLKAPMNKKGTAILALGQHLSSWKLGVHKGRHEALVQCDDLLIYRDNNKDDKLDYSSSFYTDDLIGLNIHTVYGEIAKIFIGQYSAGCQVIADPIAFAKEFITIVKKSANLYGNLFSYTLFDNNQFTLKLA